MMDLPCPKCAEPWDLDSLHEEASERGVSFDVVSREFQTKGCKALETAFGPMHCVPSNSIRAQAASAMYDLMGDDMDGVASMMDDFE